MVSFLKYFSKFSIKESITLFSKALFVLLARNLLHCMAESWGSLVACQDCWMWIRKSFHVYLLSLLRPLEYFPVGNRHCAFLLRCVQRWKLPTKQLSSNRKLLIYVLLNLWWKLAILFRLVKNTVIQLIYCAYYSKLPSENGYLWFETNSCTMWSSKFHFHKAFNVVEILKQSWLVKYE